MIDKSEWQIAKRFIDGENERLPGDRIKKGTENNLDHSFILTQGKILLGIANKKNGILNKKPSRKVVLAEDELEKWYVLKSFNNPRKLPTSEYQIAFDLGLTNEPGLTISQSNSTRKIYLPLIYLGKTLPVYLKENNLSDDEALRIAILLALHIEDLHTGKLSKTGRKWFHCDIKPLNITVDKQGYPHLIDFGYFDDFATTRGYSKVYEGLEEKSDLFSYIRTVFVPVAIRYEYDWSQGLLSEYFVRQYPQLMELLDTTDNNLHPKASLLEIAKILTGIRCQIDESVSLDTTEAIREVNQKYEALIAPTQGDLKLEETIQSFHKEIKVLANLRELSYKKISFEEELEQATKEFTQQLEELAQPLLSIFTKLDNQSRKSRCLGNFYLHQHKLTVASADKVAEIKHKKWLADLIAKRINKINLQTIQTCSHFNELQKLVKKQFQYFQTATEHEIYMNNLPEVAEKRNFWRKAVLAKIVELGLLEETTRSNYATLDYTDELNQTFLIEGLYTFPTPSLFHACIPILHELEPVFSYGFDRLDLTFIRNYIENSDFRKIINMFCHQEFPLSKHINLLNAFSNKPENSKESLPVFEWLFENNLFQLEDIKGLVVKYLTHFYSLTPILLQKMTQSEVLTREDLTNIFESNQATWLEKHNPQRHLFDSLMKKLDVDNELKFNVAADFDVETLEYLHRILPIFKHKGHLTTIILNYHETIWPVLKKLQTAKVEDARLVILCTYWHLYNEYKLLFNIILQLDNAEFQNLNFDFIEKQFVGYDKDKLKAFNQQVLLQQQTLINAQTLNDILAKLQPAKELTTSTFVRPSHNDLNFIVPVEISPLKSKTATDEIPIDDVLENDFKEFNQENKQPLTNQPLTKVVATRAVANEFIERSQSIESSKDLREVKSKPETDKILIKKALQNYIDDLNKHKDTQGKINFNHGFFFGTGWWQEKNRSRNYNLANKLQQELNTESVDTVFGNKGKYIQKLKQKYPTFYAPHHCWGAQSRIDKIIEDAQIALNTPNIIPI
ncbi:MAG: hypothetical protein H0U73_07900 [Tatlockia sp.]|nr:hypothetical protein [Tatlockia sp.]